MSCHRQGICELFLTTVYSADLYITGYVSGSDEFGATSTEADISLPFLNPPVHGNIPIKEGVSISIGGQTTLQSFGKSQSTSTLAFY